MEGAITVKLADRIANTEAVWAEDKTKLKAMYIDEFPRFKAKLYKSSDKAPVSNMWHYLIAITEGW